MAQLMTNDERDFYRSQVKLAEAQEKSLKNQDNILREQIKISEEQAGFSKILMRATVVLALAAFAETIYYFELFSQVMIKDPYDFLALVVLAIILLAITIIAVQLPSAFSAKNKKR